jgi:hypothetical protein
MLNSIKDLIAMLHPVIPAAPLEGQAHYIYEGYRSVKPKVNIINFADYQSLCNYVKRFFKADMSGGFIKKNTIPGMVYVRSNDLNPLEGYRIAKYEFAYSRELSDWINAGEMTQRQVLEFLELRLKDLVNPDLYSALAAFRSSTNITVVSEVEDERNYNLVFTEREKKGTSTIPKSFKIQLKVLESDYIYEDITFRVKYTIPKHQGDSLLFSFYSPDLEKVFIRRRKDILEKIKAELIDFEFYNIT